MKSAFALSLVSFCAISTAFSQSHDASIVKYLQWNGKQYQEMGRQTVLNAELENAQAKCQRWANAGAADGITRYCQTSASQLQ